MLEMLTVAIVAVSSLAMVRLCAPAGNTAGSCELVARKLIRGCFCALVVLAVAGCSSKAPKQDSGVDEIRKTLEREQLRQEQTQREAARQELDKEVRDQLETAQPQVGAPEGGSAAEPKKRTRAPASEVAPAPGAPAPSAGAPPSDGARAPAGEPEVAPMRVDEKDNSDWDVVPVFFGTDRAEEPNPDRLKYSSERGHRLELGRALVTVPKVHEVPQIERPWSIKIPYFDVTVYEEKEDPKKHFTMPEIQKLTKAEFLKLVHDRLAASARFKDHAIVFVHGYNTSFDNAVYRTAQISYDLKFDGAAFLYSWPSGGAVASYTYDRESATAAQPYMREFLDLVVKESGAKTISIIAHSMGNQPLMEVLKDMRSATPDGVIISQIILAAPDVDADTFSNLAKRISGLANGITLYAAANDRALTISRNFWQNPRAGDVPAAGPLIVPGVDTIDMTGASTDVFALNHSGYAQNTEVLEDIGRLIQSGLRPPDQRFDRLKPIVIDRGEFWRYTAPQ